MTIYYVDASRGNDVNDGQSPESAWKSIDEVNQYEFRPGDTILFRAGNVYSTALEPTSSGTASNPITYGSYGDGPDPVISGKGLSEAIRIQNVDHIRIENFEIADCYQGVVLKNSEGSQLIELEVHGSVRNGILLKSSHNTLVEGGSSYDNGTVDDPVKHTNLGHGVLLSDGASNNQVVGMKLYGNAEDGVQLSPDAGDGNVIKYNEMYGNFEDGLDSKNGSQIIIGNYIHDNASNAVLIHKNSQGDTITLTDNRLQAEDGNALDVSAGAKIVSEGNIYEDLNSIAVHLHSDAGKASFTDDTLLDEGKYAGDWQIPASEPTEPVEEPVAQVPVAEVPALEESVAEESSDPLDEALNDGEQLVQLDGADGDNRIIGRTADEAILGEGGNDILQGGAGHDVIEGGEGDDVLRGGDGDDVVIGGAGNDDMDGRSGADRFMFDPGFGHDVIRGFEARADSIDLSGLSGAEYQSSQDGDDVRLSFGDGSDILIKQFLLADLEGSIVEAPAASTHDTEPLQDDGGGPTDVGTEDLAA